MARTLKPLPRIRTDRDVGNAIQKARKLQKEYECKVADTPGLYLISQPDGRQRWMHRFNRPDGRATERGIDGHPPHVTIDQARAAVLDRRYWLRHHKKDPKEVKEVSEKQSKSWAEVADMWIELNKHRRRGNRSLYNINFLLHTHAKPFAHKGIAHISKDDLVKALTPLWEKKHYKTMLRVLAKWKRVFDFARESGFDILRLNPAQWKEKLEHRLPLPPLPENHHPAIPYIELPALIQKVRQRQIQRGSTAAIALEYAFFTLARSNEILGMKWSEIDWEARVWTIPEDRAKTRKVFRIPLNDRAMQILCQQQERSLGGDFVFSGYSQGQRPLTHGTMLEILKSIVPDKTVHGISRSCFRDWAGDTTDFAREDIEMCLGHVIGNKVERAYRRGDALEKRRVIMDTWGAYCGSEEYKLPVQHLLINSMDPSG
jgi:integrase